MRHSVGIFDWLQAAGSCNGKVGDSKTAVGNWDAIRSGAEEVY